VDIRPSLKTNVMVIIIIIIIIIIIWPYGTVGDFAALSASAEFAVFGCSLT